MPAPASPSRSDTRAAPAPFYAEAVQLAFAWPPHAFEPDPKAGSEPHLPAVYVPPTLTAELTAPRRLELRPQTADALMLGLVLALAAGTVAATALHGLRLELRPQTADALMLGLVLALAAGTVAATALHGL